MAKLSSADLLDAFKEMTLLELSEFVKSFEETFDVKAAAPVAVAAAAGGAGAVIRQVIPNGPAAGAGFAPGDVINSINGQPVNSATALTAILDQHHPGDNVQVGVAGRSASVTLADGPPG